MVRGKAAGDLSPSSVMSFSGRGCNEYCNGPQMRQGGDVGCSRKLEYHDVEWRVREERGIPWEVSKSCRSTVWPALLDVVAGVQVENAEVKVTHILY